ncbi:MAG: hypothetical protein EOP62_14380 [Sphingomonadales bacterium]|nr:MAG: hypothetical protein EOP62_14380 [Sphingomonadales bacterium]
MDDQGTQSEQRPAFLTADNRVPLLVPVNYSIGEERQVVAELQLKRLTAAERLMLDEPMKYTEKQLRLLERMTALPRTVLLKLDEVDLDRVDECFGYFRTPGSVTGAIS